MNYTSTQIINDDCLNILPKIKSGSVDLVIADPPYFKVINQKWDYQWRTEEEYLSWCTSWIKEIYRILRYGGTFYLFGYFKILSRLVPIVLDFGFDVRQQIIVDKGLKSIAGRATKNYKLFPNTTESILFLVKDNIPISKKILKSRQKVLQYSSKYINEQLGVKSNGGGMWSIYTGDNVCRQFPTKSVWNKLQNILKFNIPYEKMAQTFNPQMGLTNVWDDIDFYSEKRFHPTQKPATLIERLILTSSYENDLIVDPFGGSGTTAIVADILNRKSIVIEKDKKYIESYYERISKGENVI